MAKNSKQIVKSVSQRLDKYNAMKTNIRLNLTYEQITEWFDGDIISDRHQAHIYRINKFIE